MIVKETEFKHCPECGKKGKIISTRIYGCDSCKKEFTHDDALRLQVFSKDIMNTTHHHFCCWKCVLEFLPKIKSDGFVDLPYLSYEKEKEGCGAKDFIELIKTIK